MIFFSEIIFKVFLFGELDVFRYENKISMRCFACSISNKKIEKKVTYDKYFLRITKIYITWWSG